MEKYDVSSLNELIKKTGEIIDRDPMVAAGHDITQIKENFEAIQRAINNDGMDPEEKQGLLASIFGSWTSKDENFQYKSFEGKINSIFKQYDDTFDSIGNSIEMYMQYGTGLVTEIDKLVKFLEGYSTEGMEQQELREYSNYEVMLQNLQFTLKRIEMSKTSGDELHETMRTGRPIFQTILSSCLIEVAGQKSLDASVQMLGTITGTIETLSSKLTETAIKTSQISLDVGTKPVLSASHLKDNMLTLGNAINDLEKRKNKLLAAPVNKGQEETIIK